MEMANYSRILVLLCLLSACELDQNSSLAEPKAEGIIGTWQYHELFVADVMRTPFANNLMEPGIWKGDLGGERAEINRRQIRYYEDGSYQITWLDRGAYELGTEGTPNWQPGFGTFRLKADGDSLIHNALTPSAYDYAIELKGDTLVRTSLRYMSSYSSQFSGSFYTGAWNVGDYVKYQEIFVRQP